MNISAPSGDMTKIISESKINFFHIRNVCCAHLILHKAEEKLIPICYTQGTTPYGILLLPVCQIRYFARNRLIG